MKKYIALALVLLSILSIGYILSEFSGYPVTYTTAPTSNPAAVTPEPTKPFTLEEVKLHNTAADCWAAIEGDVYDVSQFVGIHPGQQGIVAGCGTDATLLFNSEDNHTPVRRELMKIYKIGILVDSKTQ